MLSATPTAALIGGILTITGTENADRIVLSPSGSARPFGRSFGGRMAPPMSIGVEGVASFRLNQVRAVKIVAGGGDDIIIINDSGRFAISTFIDAGSGNDVVIGGSGVDNVYGGTGNDILEGRGGVNALDGGPGLNRIGGVWVGTLAPTPQAPPPAVAESPPIRPIPTPISMPAPAPPPLPIGPPSSPTLSAWAQQIVELTNRHRTQNGLSPLVVDAKLSQMAGLQAQQMAELDKMQHDLPEARYPDLRSRADAVGYRFTGLGENIAFNYPDPEGVVQGWILSEGHRRNILHSGYTQIGVSVALNRDGRPYFAQVFGSPA